MVAIVGNIRPPQISLVNDAGLEFPLRSVGTRGKHDVRSKYLKKNVLLKKNLLF